MPEDDAKVEQNAHWFLGWLHFQALKAVLELVASSVDSYLRLTLH